MKFNFAKVTKSRLMGSIALIVGWIDEDGKYFNQYFLLDAEGLGIADYVSIYNPTKKQAYIEEERLMGGLGSDRVRINEEEAKFLINYFGQKNISYSKELPGEVEEYESIIMNHTTNLTINDILPKVSIKIDDEIEFVNYMTMRLIARDRESLKYYSTNEEIANMHITEINGTLLKNRVSKKGEYKFISEALYEDIDGYYTCRIAFSLTKDSGELKIKSLLITDVEEMFDFEVFDEISKPEYIAIYNVDNNEIFEEKFYEENPFTQKSFMDEGTIYTRFNFNNNHVKENVYIINNDIKSIYYIMDNLLFVATYSDRDRMYINKMLICNYKEYINYKEEFYFEENVLYDFAESGSTDFEDFLE